MINLKELQDSDVGKWVTYTTNHGTIERGRIKSWNNTYIFVVYNCDGEWKSFKDYTVSGTDPQDLTWG